LHGRLQTRRAPSAGSDPDAERQASKNRTPRYPYGILFAFLIGAACGAVLSSTVSVETSPQPSTCAKQIALQAHSELLAGRHQQWLETPPHFARSDISLWQLYPHYVVDTRSGLAYNWGVTDVDPIQEQLRFGVLTRWAMFNPGWANDAWVLFYDCLAAPS
jgi:hypothetical protein